MQGDRVAVKTKKCKTCDIIAPIDDLNANGMCAVCIVLKTETCNICNITVPIADLNAEGLCAACAEIYPLDRNPLEVFGLGTVESLCVDGSVLVYTWGNKKTTIPISSIQTISISMPGLLNKNGRIRIATAEPAIMIWGTATSRALIISFYSTNEIKYAENIKKYIADFQTGPSEPMETSAPCKLDQIAKLKSLLDDGAITQEEFEQLKKEIIG